MSIKISDQIIAELLKDCQTPEDIFGENGLLSSLNNKIVKYANENQLCASFESIDDSGFSDYIFAKSLGISTKIANDIRNEIVSLYSRGMSQLQIQLHIRETKKVNLNAKHISSIISESTIDMELWRDRKLDSIYPIVYLDAMYILVKDNGIQKKKAVHIALAINLEGRKEVLGLWIENNESSKAWANILTGLKNRGVNDIFIVCCDNLKGLSKTIKAIYPDAQTQLCMAHQKRSSLACVKNKDKSNLSKDLLAIYTAPTLNIAEKQLDEMSKKWKDIYPNMIDSWYNNWENLTPFYDYIPELRRVLYTTNAIESLNSALRTVAQRKRVFGSDQIALNAMYLYLEILRKKWIMPIAHWQLILNQFQIIFEDRF